MSEHRTTITWRRDTPGFGYAEYRREHEWRTGSGQRFKASSAPAFLGDGESIDPEEAFVGSVASCHMLTFLAICARRRIVVDAYQDAAVGFLRKNGAGRLAITRVELYPEITFSDKAPVAAELQWLHERSHEECFIANSVSTEIIVCEPPRPD